MHIVAANTDHFSNPKKYYGIQLQDSFSYRRAVFPSLF